jgi:hypothetical protein
MGSILHPARHNLAMSDAQLAPASATGESWLTPGRFALLLAALFLAAFPGVLLGGSTFIIRDFGLFSYPVASFQRECFWRGEMPLWNPLNNCGLPFLAQWNTMGLYPPALIYLLLPLSWSLPFFSLAHLFWGGLGMYFLARHWTGNALAAGVAGIIFAFNGLSLNFLMWPSHAATFGWLPWVVWLVQLAWRNGGRYLGWAALAGSMQMLAGGPETILLTWITLWLLAAGDAITGAAAPDKITLRFGCMVVLVAVVCAAQLLPFLELLTHSQRDTGYGSSAWSMPIWGWANFLEPIFRTVPSTQGLHQQREQYWTSSYYAGATAILLSLVALRRSREWRVWLLGGLVLLGMLLALGDDGLVYHGLRKAVPSLGFLRYPVKFTILTLALAPALAAYGVKRLVEKTPALGRFEWICAAVLLTLLGGLAFLDWRSPIPGGVGGETVRNALVRGALFAVAIGALAGFMRSSGKARIILGSLLLVSMWLDFVTHTPAQNPSAQPSVYAAGWARGQLKMDPQPQLGQSRVMLAPTAQQALKTFVMGDIEKNYLLERLAFLADCNLLDDVPQVSGFYSLTPSDSYAATILPYIYTNRDFPVLLDFLGVSQTTAPGKVFEWTNRPSAMSFITAGQKVFFVNEQTAFEALFQTNLDLRSIVFLPKEAESAVTTTRQPSAKVVPREFTNHKITFETEAGTNCIVVLSQTFYPAWKAYVDGQPVKLWKANYAFQALQVPGGRHAVKLVYEDKKLRNGGCLSAVGLMISAGILFKGRGRRPAA